MTHFQKELKAGENMHAELVNECRAIARTHSYHGRPISDDLVVAVSDEIVVRYRSSDSAVVRGGSPAEVLAEMALWETIASGAERAQALWGPPAADTQLRAAARALLTAPAVVSSTRMDNASRATMVERLTNAVHPWLFAETSQVSIWEEWTKTTAARPGAPDRTERRREILATIPATPDALRAAAQAGVRWLREWRGDGIRLDRAAYEWTGAEWSETPIGDRLIFVESVTGVTATARCTCCTEQYSVMAPEWLDAFRGLPFAARGATLDDAHLHQPAQRVDPSGHLAEVVAQIVNKSPLRSPVPRGTGRGRGLMRGLVMAACEPNYEPSDDAHGCCGECRALPAGGRAERRARIFSLAQLNGASYQGPGVDREFVFAAL